MGVELEHCTAQQTKGLLYIGLQFSRVLSFELRLKSNPCQDRMGSSFASELVEWERRIMICEGNSKILPEVKLRSEG